MLLTEYETPGFSKPETNPTLSAFLVLLEYLLPSLQGHRMSHNTGNIPKEICNLPEEAQQAMLSKLSFERVA